MQTYTITLKEYSIDVDSHLDKLVQSNDRECRSKLTEEVMDRLRSQNPNVQDLTLNSNLLNSYALKYGEQYAADVCTDLERYFDIINLRLLSPRVTTHDLLYIFGTGKKYKPNISGLSAAGEGVAGYCMEQSGFSLWVRPLEKMPDAVHCINRGTELHITLTEAKGSIADDALRLVQKNVFEFLVAIKTRARSFRNIYEGYLIGSRFLDGGRVECVSLKIGLEEYWGENYKTVPGGPPRISPPIAPWERPRDRLRDLIRVQHETLPTRDEYLTQLVSGEAWRVATLMLMTGGQAEYEAADQQANRLEVPTPEDVETHVQKVAEELGYAESWRQGQDLIKETKGRQEQVIKSALEKARKLLKLSQRRTGSRLQ